MVKVVAKHFVKEDKIEEMLSVVKELVSATIKQEGCLKYEMYQDEKDKKVLTMIEEWETREDLTNHMNSKEFKSLVPQLGKFMEKSGEINIYNRLI